jgi:hypothetical protein
VERYGGELLPGYYEPWVLTERERLAQAYLGALRRLIKIHEQNQEWPQAIDAAYRMVAAAPLEEDGYRDLIRVLAAAGQPAAAVRQYHELERRLREEVGEAPSEETHDLVRHLLEEAVVTATAFPIRRSVPGAGPKAAPVAFAAEPMLFKERPGQQGASSSDPVLLSFLPVPLTRFSARKEEKARLAVGAGGASAGLLTVTGLGGSDKTRLFPGGRREMPQTYSRRLLLCPPVGGRYEPNGIPPAMRRRWA